MTSCFIAAFYILEVNECNGDVSPTSVPGSIIMDTMESVLIITGTMGAGKTSVLAEASDILALQGIAHAAIDLDALGLAHLPSAARCDGVMYGNLSICLRELCLP